MLAERLQALGIGVVLTREPGGSPGAEAIRHVLLSGAAKPLGPHAEAILFAAARDDHLRQTIRPALERGAWVICDRFADSTRVYQGVLGNVDARLIARLERVTVGDLRPDLTFILDIAAGDGLARATKRRGDAPADRFEAEAIDFHEKLREAYLELAEREPERCVLIDAGADRRDASPNSSGPPSNARLRPGRSALMIRDAALVSAAARTPKSRIRARRSSLFGHAEAEQALLDAYRGGRMPHAWLIGGAARHRQGDARLPHGALRARASRSGAPAVRKRNVARAAGRSSGRPAASPRRRTATCWCWSASTTRSGKLRTVHPGRHGARARSASSARPRARAAGGSASSIPPTS